MFLFKWSLALHIVQTWKFSLGFHLPAGRADAPLAASWTKFLYDGITQDLFSMACWEKLASSFICVCICYAFKNQSKCKEYTPHTVSMLITVTLFSIKFCFCTFISFFLLWFWLCFYTFIDILIIGKRFTVGSSSGISLTNREVRFYAGQRRLWCWSGTGPVCGLHLEEGAAL